MPSLCLRRAVDRPIRVRQVPSGRARLMTCPAFRATIPGTTARVTASSPFTLVSIISSQFSGSSSYSLLSPRLRPALLTRTSMAFQSSGSPRWPHRLLHDHAHPAGRERLPLRPLHQRRFQFSQQLQTTRTQQKPRSAPANANAVARPIPELAPVIRTTLPSKYLILHL